MVAGPNPAEGSISLSLFDKREPELRENSLDLLSDGFAGLCSLIMASFRAFSQNWLTFMPIFIAVLSVSWSMVSVVLTFLPKMHHHAYLCIHADKVMLCSLCCHKVCYILRVLMNIFQVFDGSFSKKIPIPFSLAFAAFNLNSFKSIR